MLARDTGIVLRCIRLGETSLIVSVLGTAHGRVRLVARGVRVARHRFGSCLEPGNEIETVFSARPGRELGTLREASLRRAWLAGGRSLAGLGAGLGALELLERALPEGPHDRELVDDARGLLAALREHGGRRETAIHLFYAFEHRLLSRLGLGPSFEACAACGDAAAGSGRVLDVAAGVVSCKVCDPIGPGKLFLPPGVLAAFRALDSWDAAARMDAEPAIRRAVGTILHRLLASHLDRYRPPRALAMLQKVDSQASSGRESAPADVSAGTP